MFKWAFKIVLFIIGLYIFYGAMLFFFQGQFVYQPSSTGFNACTNFSDEEKFYEGNTRFFYRESSGDDLVVIYHGNAGSACDREFLAEFFFERGYSTLILEYPGYGGSIESKSRATIEQDIVDVIDFVEEQDKDNVHIMGISLGSYFATYHTTRQDVESLITINSLTSITRVMEEKIPIYPISLMVRENYNSLEIIGDIRAQRSLTVHGEKDIVIPIEYGREYYDNLPLEDKLFVEIPGRNHNEIFKDPLTMEALTEFILEE